MPSHYERCEGTEVIRNTNSVILINRLGLTRAMVRRGHVVSAIAACAGNATKISPFESILITANST